MASTINASTTQGVQFSGDTSGALALQTNNGTTAVTIDTSQNVGIGTASPAQKLDIASKVQVDTSNSYGKIKIARATDSGVTALYIQGADNAGTANELSLVNAGGGGAAINITGGDLRFYATSNTTERMRIDSSGNVLVGDTSNYFYSGKAFFNTSSGNTIVTFSSSSGQAALLSSVSTTSANLATFIYAPNGAHNSTGSAGIGSITTNGTTTAYNITSDYRLKENIIPLTGALDKIAQLKPSVYNYKSDPSTQIEGFIAHELQEIVPHAVTGKKDEVDADGKPIYQGVDASFLIPHLVAAIQELKAELDTVKETVSQLQVELSALKGIA